MTSISKSPEISIIMPTRNRSPLMSRQIDAIRRQNTNHTWELIVVDNGSSDDTLTIVDGYATLDPRVRPTSATKRADAAYSRNQGASIALAPLLAFVDDDDLVSPEWLDAIVEAMKVHPLVACSMEYDLLNTRAVTDGWPKPQVSSLVTVDGYPVCNAAIGIHRELWDRLGGQVEGHLGEDSDMALRSARDFGVAPHLIIEAVYHRQLPVRLRDAFRLGRREGRGVVQRSIAQTRGRFMSRTEALGVLRAYWWLLSRLPWFIAGRRRHLWLLSLGDRFGRISESIANRVVYL